MNEFVAFAKNKAEIQKEFMPEPTSNGAFWFTSLPFVSYTSATFSQVGSGAQATVTPLFAWGKYFNRECVQGLDHTNKQKIGHTYDCRTKIILPFTMEVHHSFVDEIHIGKLVSAIQYALNHPEQDQYDKYEL